MKNRLLPICLFTLIPSIAKADVLEADSSKVVDLDEVMIVSTPKEQVRLRQQPLSSTVLGSEQISQLKIQDLSQLSQYVPAFIMPSYGSRLTSSMYIRGIGSRINNPAVGVYYDNIPIMSKASFNNHFYMLDRVDVLRGPQGTLYGQNTEGGLVRIYSKNPMAYQGTDIRMGIGTGLYSNVEVAHYHRPTNSLAFSVSGFYSGLQGFIDNQNFAEKNDLTNEAGGKMRLIYKPTGQLTFDLITDFQYVNQNGFGYGENDADPVTTIMNGYKRNMLNTGLNLSYEAESLLLTSTTSYQYLKDLMVMDQDYIASDYLRLQQRQKQNALTQELVLRSHGIGSWQHTSGLYGSYQWLRTDAPVFFGDAVTGPISQAIANAMKRALPPTMQNSDITMTAEMAVPEYFHTPQACLAVFHESNILLSDILRLTVGLRLNHDVVKIDYDALAYMTLTGGMGERIASYTLTSHVNDHLSKSFTQVLPKFGLTYMLGNNLGNVYALVSKGYRTGGYNIQMFSDILQTELADNQRNAMRGDYDVEHSADDYYSIEQTMSYKPEESWNYEAGTHLNFLGGGLHADMSFYYMKICNQQLSVMSPDYNYGRMMVNAGKSHSCGVELSLRGRAVSNRLDWGVTYAFTSAKFDEYNTHKTLMADDGASSHLAEISYKDKFVPFVPRHTFSAMSDYHSGHFAFGLNLTGQGRIWWDESNTFSQNLFATLGAHADYDFGFLAISLWGRNLTNTRYNVFAISSSATGSVQTFSQRANPIQVGVDVQIHL